MHHILCEVIEIFFLLKKLRILFLLLLLKFVRTIKTNIIFVIYEIEFTKSLEIIKGEKLPPPLKYLLFYEEIFLLNLKYF